MRTLGPFGRPQRAGSPDSSRLIDEPDRSRDGRSCPETSPSGKSVSADIPAEKDPHVHPFRAFFFSLTCGLALLFSARVLIFAMQPAPDQRVGSGPIEIPRA
jgi:hypothetical protein